MLRVKVAINPLIRLVMKKARRLTYLQRQDRVWTLHLLLCRHITRTPPPVCESIHIKAVEELYSDDEVNAEVLYHAELACDIKERYFDYLNDIDGYDCHIQYDLGKQTIELIGGDKWLREKLSA